MQADTPCSKPKDHGPCPDRAADSMGCNAKYPAIVQNSAPRASSMSRLNTEPAPTRAADLASERNRAEQLVWANRLYRETAAATGDSSVVDLLDQLERVLVEVAASSPNSSQRELDDVRRRIESGSLLFKVRVVSSDLLERRRAAMRQTGQRSSL